MARDIDCDVFLCFLDFEKVCIQYQQFMNILQSSVINKFNLYYKQIAQIRTEIPGPPPLDRNIRMAESTKARALIYPRVNKLVVNISSIIPSAFFSEDEQVKAIQNAQLFIIYLLGQISKFTKKLLNINQAVLIV